MENCSSTAWNTWNFFPFGQTLLKVFEIRRYCKSFQGFKNFQSYFEFKSEQVDFFEFQYNSIARLCSWPRLTIICDAFDFWEVKANSSSTLIIFHDQRYSILAFWHDLKNFWSGLLLSTFQIFQMFTSFLWKKLYVTSFLEKIQLDAQSRRYAELDYLNIYILEPSSDFLVSVK